jgi:hypothetical protein
MLSFVWCPEHATLLSRVSINKTGKTKYTIGSIHLTALTSGVLPAEQSERLITNRFVNVQGGRNNNIALDEYLEMLTRDNKVACSGHQTKESIIKHSQESGCQCCQMD